jgi:hypothetical protein
MIRTFGSIAHHRRLLRRVKALCAAITALSRQWSRADANRRALTRCSALLTPAHFTVEFSASSSREKDMILHVDHLTFQPGPCEEQRQPGPDLGQAFACAVTDGEGGQR